LKHFKERNGHSAFVLFAGSKVQERDEGQTPDQKKCAYVSSKFSFKAAPLTPGFLLSSLFRVIL